MMRRIAAVLMALVLGASARAMQRVNVTCSQAGAVQTSGLSSSNKAAIVYPSCQIAVYMAGTTTLAPIFSDNNGTVLANPFTATTQGTGFFYANLGRYDITISGGGMPAPYTTGDVLLQDINQINGTFAIAGVGAPTAACAAANTGQIYTDTVTGYIYTCTGTAWKLTATNASYPGVVTDTNNGLNVQGSVTTGPNTASTIVSPNIGAIRYASQWQNGTGNNGIGNAASANQTVVADPSYASTEQPGPTSFSQPSFHFQDLRGGQFLNFYHNVYLSPFNFGYYPLNTTNLPIAAATYCMYDQYKTSWPNGTGSGGTCNAWGLQVNSPGWSIGNPSGFGAGAAGGWAGANMLSTAMSVRQSGIANYLSGQVNKYSVGDFNIFTLDIFSNAGMSATSDEGVSGLHLAFEGDWYVFQTTCSSATACTTGSQSIKTPVANGVQGQGRYVMDCGASCTTPTTVLSGQVTAIAAGINGATAYTVTPASMPISNAWGYVVTNPVNTPVNPVPPFTTQETFSVQVTNGTFDTTHLMCMIGNYYEQFIPTVVTNPSGPVATITAMLRYPHINSTTSGVFQGPPCGQGIELPAFTYTVPANGVGGAQTPNRYLFNVAGATDAQTLQIAVCIGGSCTTTNFIPQNIYQTIGFTNATNSSGTTVSFFYNFSGTMFHPWLFTANSTILLAGSSDAALNTYCTNVTWTSITVNPATGTCTIAGLSGTHTTTTAMTATWAPNSVPANNFSTYYIAQVTDSQNEALSPPQVDGTLYLEPNLIPFNAGDQVEETNYVVSGYKHQLNTSVTGPYSRFSPLYLVNNGKGINSYTNAPVGFLRIDNQEPNSTFIGYGGKHTPPPAILWGQGVYGNGLNFSTAGPTNEGCALCVTTNTTQKANASYNYNMFIGSNNSVTSSTYTIYPNSGNVIETTPGTKVENAFLGSIISSPQGANVASLLMNGNIYVSGTGTTAFPFLFIQQTNSAAVTNWNTAGTMFGVNIPGSYSSQFISFRKSSATEYFGVLNDGSVNSAGNVNIATGKTYQINSVPISSANLSDSTSILKSVSQCGTTTACANTAVTNPRMVIGSVTLAAGTAVITGINPAWASTTSYSCTCSDTSATATSCDIIHTSTTSITIDGTGTDTVYYICAGN